MRATILLGGIMINVLAGWLPLRAAEDQPLPENASAAAPVAKDGDGADVGTDRYQLPDGDVKELLAFIESLREFQPTDRAELVAHRKRSLPAMIAAARRALELASEEDKTLDGFDDAEALVMLGRVSEVRQMSDQDVERLRDDIKSALLKSAAPSRYAVTAGAQLAGTLEQLRKPQLAIEVYRQLGDVLAKSPRSAKSGAKMQGAARRLDLLGNPLELRGTTVAGEAFDWESYRGHVVLIDFWATWCGPCRAELPNLKKNYELYHERGFDVVGVNLDNDRETLDTYLAEKPLPWVTLYDGAWSDNLNATNYGIMGIPTVILVDKEGKVVSTAARGEELGKLLAQILGPAETTQSPTDQPAAATN